jgi:hypothetical protein
MRPVVRLGQGFDVTLKTGAISTMAGTDNETSTLCPSTDLLAGQGIEDIGSGDTHSAMGPPRWRERR